MILLANPHVKVMDNRNDVIEELPVHTRFQNNISETAIGVYTCGPNAGYNEEIRNILAMKSFDYVLLDEFHDRRNNFIDAFRC